VLVEEALLAGIPTLVLDPKGDLGNLLLTFPELRPDDFAPWVEGGDGAGAAAAWTEGLAGWGIGPERIAALRAAAEFTIYTPGSTAGVPLNIVGGLARPTAAGGAEPDAETVADEIEGFVSGLLTMVGIDADPLAGREHILLSNLIDHAWASGRDLDLPTLVTQVQDPPLRKLGVYELEAFYPAKDRTRLAMTLNGLLASRSFAAWAEGPDLDLDRLLRSADGARPACAVVTLAHLSDEERQFVVSLLLGRLVTWMRRQPGTDRLRVLVYFDEVLGFVPPTAAPPAKKPILTLFKQARAFGVGLVLATPWTSTTRAWPTPAPGSSGGCRPSRTGTGCWTACRRPAGPWTWPPRATRSAGWASGSSCCASPGPPPPRCSPPAGPCRTCGGRSPASRSPR
jgi:hypothetical protein